MGSKQKRSILIAAMSGILVLIAFNNCAKDLDEAKLTESSSAASQLSLNAANYQVQRGQSTALTVTGGTAPYSYEVVPAGNGAVDSSAYFLASANGVTTVRVTDAAGLITEISVTVVDPPPPPPAGCTPPFGAAIAHNAAITAWNVAVGACASETRVCVNGNLSGGYTHASCRAPLPCATPWNTTIASGASVTAYATTSSTSACQGITRTCNDGVLSGNTAYRYSFCNFRDR